MRRSSASDDDDRGLMRKLIFLLCLTVFLILDHRLGAAIFGKIQGIVHDPQHRPVAGASVKLQATTSDWSQTGQTDGNGEFSFTSVPVGDYRVTVMQTGFETSAQAVTVTSGTSPILHFQFAIEIARNVVESQRLSTPIDYATAVPFAKRFLRNGGGH